MLRHPVPHEITVRQKPHGGGLLEQAREYPNGELRRRRELILLVHGFNVTVCDAGAAYDSFLANAAQPVIDGSVEVYWPGDVIAPLIGAVAGGELWTKFISGVHYPRQRQHAELSAQLVSEIISQSLQGRDNVRLTIIAHSLGCRLALELLLLLKSSRDERRITVPLVILMAPAVPRYLVLPGGRLHFALRVADKIILYRSLKDDVLKWVFRAGQSLEAPFPEGWNIVHRTALGRNGFGLARPRHVTEVEATCGHGGYWPDPNIAYELGRVAFGAELAARAATGPAGPWRATADQGLGRRLEGRALQPRGANSVVRSVCRGLVRV